MTSFHLLPKIVKFLTQNPEQKFTARSIAVWIFKTYPEECREKQTHSTNTDNDTKFINQLVSEIGSWRNTLQRRYPKIKTIEGYPRKYYYTEASDRVEIDLAEHSQRDYVVPNGNKVTEHDLYPILSNFLFSELAVYSKRIDEKHSSNSHGAGGNKWLYPDLVGMENLSKDWHREIKDCVQQYADKKTKLWAFEVKIRVNRSNVREVFFQAVSNSSWANFGYLVASEIEGANTLKELQILSGLHGIGFIRLEVDNPSESQIMIPAKEKSEIDWNTANRLAEENKDFLDYISLVRQFYQTGVMRNIDWDATDAKPSAFKFNSIRTPNNERIKIIPQPVQNINEGIQSTTKAMQYRYWQKLRAYLESTHSNFHIRTPQPQHWQTFSIGRSHFHIDATVNTLAHKISIELLITHSDKNESKAFYHLLTQDKEAIENEMGISLEWKENPNKTPKIIVSKSNVNIANEEDWGNQDEWFKVNLEKFDKVFRNRIKNLTLD